MSRQPRMRRVNRLLFKRTRRIRTRATSAIVEILEPKQLLTAIASSTYSDEAWALAKEMRPDELVPPTDLLDRVTDDLQRIRDAYPATREITHTQSVSSEVLLRLTEEAKRNLPKAGFQHSEN